MKPVLAALLLSMPAGPALADSCEALAAASMEALEGSDADPETRAAFRGMIEDAMRLHAGGRHEAAHEALQTAMMMLGLM